MFPTKCELFSTVEKKPASSDINLLSLSRVSLSHRDIAMLARSSLLLALAGSAAAFSPMMSMDLGRREVAVSPCARRVFFVRDSPGLRRACARRGRLAYNLYFVRCAVAAGAGEGVPPVARVICLLVSVLCVVRSCSDASSGSMSALHPSRKYLARQIVQAGAAAAAAAPLLRPNQAQAYDVGESDAVRLRTVCTSTLAASAGVCVRTH